MEGSSLVLEKNDSEDSCGDQEERSSDIVFIVILVGCHPETSSYIMTGQSYVVYSVCTL